MRDIEKRVLEFIALATPVNNDRQPCCCNVQAATSDQVKLLAAQLSAVKMRGHTYERPSLPPQRITLHPAPWLRRQITLDGRAQG